MRKGKVFTPININAMVLDHRIVMAPTVHEMCDDGLPSEALYEVIKSYASGEAAMVCVGGANTDPNPEREIFPGVQSAADDRALFALWRLAETIKTQGAKACQQIYHPGRGSARYGYKRTGILPLGAGSEVPYMVNPDIKVTREDGKWNVEAVVEQTPVREATEEEIVEIIKNYILAAVRVMRAGFDAINVHLANVTLPMDFMSPLTNHRTDAWGGSWENRMRMPCEIVEGIRVACGKDFPVIVRIPTDQGLGDRGIQLSDTVKEIVPRLEEAGADAIDLSAGVLDMTPHVIIPTFYSPRATWAKWGVAVKKVTKLPVMLPGRLCTPQLVEKAIEEEWADVANLCRPFMADPELPRKMREGRDEDVRSCVGCAYCFSPKAWGRLCAVNADMGRETVLPKIEQAERVKKVLVVGGGPGGMEAARVLSLRGHDVSLYERQDMLGGVLRVASANPLSRDWSMFIRWLKGQVDKLGVKVELGTEVTPAVVKELKPDAVVIATGASPCKDVKGADRTDVVTEDDALMKKVDVGQKVVVLGGVFWDVDTAVALARRGKDVTLVRQTPGLAPELGYLRTMAFMTGMLQESGVKPLFQTGVEEIGEEGVRVCDASGKTLVLQADRVVLAMGRVPRRGLADALQGEVDELYEVGDCAKASNVADAVHAARLLGNRV